MHSDTRTAWLIFLAVSAVAGAVPAGMILYDRFMEARTPPGMVYTAGNGPTGAKYEPKGKGTEKLR